MVHDLMCRNEFSCRFDEVWFLATGPVVTGPKFFAEFSK